MALSGKNITLPIYHRVNGVQTSFHDLVLHKFTVDSVVMSLGDKITGDIYYPSPNLVCSMKEYVVFNDIEYTIVNPPTLVKEGMVSDNSDLKGMSKYSFEFYHPMYILGNLPFTDVAVSYDELRYKSQDKTFAWIGKPADFVAKLNKNLENTEWVVVMSDRFPQEKEDQLSEVLTFDKNTIAEVLKTGYETWEVPFVVDKLNQGEYYHTDANNNNVDYYTQGKRFVVVFGLPSNEIYETESDRQNNRPFVFQYGQGVGLKNHSRTPRNNKIVTRIAGYGSERNIPYGYPQIIWYGDPNATCTIGSSVGPVQNVTINGTTYDWVMSYPIYEGIVNGQWVKLIKHPFTRKTLMPTIYVGKPYDENDESTESIFSGGVFNKVSQFLPDGTANQNFNPNLEIKDYYDAVETDTDYNLINYVNPVAPSYESHEFEDIYPELGEAKILGATPINADLTDASGWDDTMDDNGNYLQSYFKITLPRLDFDIYACAAITEEMEINMRSGACIGCTFTVQVDWEDYKRNFYDSDMNFAPNGSQRDLTKYPNSANGSITVVVQKDINTFGTIMPNIYQYPQAGDDFVILGISLPLSYIESAQARLDDAMKSYMLENNLYYYDYPLKFDEHFLATYPDILNQIRPNTIIRFLFNGVPLELFVKQLTIKFNENTLPQYDITLTDNVEVVLNSIGQVTEDVEHLSTLIALLRQEYNRNVWVELSKKLSKVNDDTAQGLISFAQGWQTSGFFSNNFLGYGAKVDERGVGEFEEVNIRGALRAAELVFNLIRAEGGEKIESIGYGEIETVTINSSNQNRGTATLKLDGDEWATIKAGDICRGVYNTLGDENLYVLEPDDNDVNGFRNKVGFFSSYFRIINVTSSKGECTFTYQLQVSGKSASQSSLNSNTSITEHPCPLMKFAVYGNIYSYEEERQSSIYTTAVGLAPRKLYLAGVNDWKIKPENIKIAIGNIDGVGVWTEVDEDTYNAYQGSSDNKKTWDDENSQPHWAVIEELVGKAGFYCENNIYLGGVIQQIKAAVIDSISSQISNLGQSWVSVSDDVIVVDCNSNGTVATTKEVTIDSWLYFGGDKCELDTGNTNGMPSCYYSYGTMRAKPSFSENNTKASKTYTFTQGDSLSGGVISIFLKGEYGNTTYSATKTVSIIANKQGATGQANGIESITTYYLLTTMNEGVEISDFGSETSYTLPTPEYPYLWKYTHFAYTNGDSYDSDPELISTYSDHPNLNLLDDTAFNDVEMMDAWTEKGTLNNYGSLVPAIHSVVATNGTFQVQFRGNQGNGGEGGYIEYLTQPVHSSSVDKILPNSWYTLSFWLYGQTMENGATTSKTFQLDLSMGNLYDANANRYVDGQLAGSVATIHFIPTTVWTKHTVTFKTPSTLSTPMNVRWLMYTMYVTQIIQMKMPKLEIGMVATDYLEGNSTVGQPMARASKWETGKNFFRGAIGERWLDITSLNGKWFQCIKSHISNNSNKPQVGQDNTWWRQANNFGFVATDLLLADQAIINLMFSQKILMTNEENQLTASINDDEKGSYCIYYPESGRKQFEMSSTRQIIAYNDNEGNTLAWWLGNDGVIHKAAGPSWSTIKLYSFGVNKPQNDSFYGNSRFLRTGYPVYIAGATGGGGNQEENGKVYAAGHNTMLGPNGNYIDDGWYTEEPNPIQMMSTMHDEDMWELEIIHIHLGVIESKEYITTVRPTEP